MLGILLSFFFLSGAPWVILGHERLIEPPPLVTDTPYFDPSMERKIVTHVGKTAEMHCRVHSLGNRTQVSWIRSRDLRILGVNRYTYITDLRHEVLHKDGTNQWTLRIKSVQPRDRGLYDCQISTKPEKSFIIELIVLEPKVEVLGAPDLYVKRDSMINLTCIMHDVPEPPGYLYWTHNKKNISYSSSRGGISHVLEKGPTTISHLLIQRARSNDSGFYTCAPAGMTPYTLRVHVLNGENSAGLQENSSSSSSLTLSNEARVTRALLMTSSVVAASTIFRYLWFVWIEVT